MGKINKILIILILVFLVVLVGGTYVTVSYVRSLSIKKQLSSELQYATDSQTEVQDKPFLSKLPIFTEKYSIYHNSLSNKIDIVFSKNGQSIDILKETYGNQILTVLTNIGVDIQKERIVWLKQQSS